MIKISKKKRLLAIFLCFTACICIDAKSISGEETPETITIKILSTGDLHGQTTAYNYEAEMDFTDYGLSKINTMITDIRKTLPGDNSILVDAGDYLYDYSTNFFYDNYPSTVQPILQLMSAMEYDCITLGNHELDYTFDYITTQLKGAELYDKTIVSNLVYADTAETVFAPSMIITKKAATSRGKTVNVRIGVVGASRKGISARRSYYGDLISGDIYKAVSKEAERLKAEEKVDLVIAVVHGGIGLISGSDTATHPGARLARLEYIDGVVTAHAHETFPFNNGTYADKLYEQIVDEEKGLIYGKPVVGNGNQGAYLGVLNYTLTINEDGSYSIGSADAELIKTDETIEESKNLKKITDKFVKMMLSERDTKQYPIAEGQIYTNMDGFIQDNDLFQLLNNAKMQFGRQYISENVPAYKDLPVIACTANILDSTDTEIYIDSYFDASIVSRIRGEQSVNRESGYMHVFKVTGKQLREWLEYNASIYASAGAYSFEETFPALHESTPEVFPLLQDAYFDNHSKYYAFDGISYTIDLSQKARYYANGRMIASANKRISSFTYNGAEVEDKQEFILVTDAFDVRYSFMPTNSQSVFYTNPWKNSKDVILEYLDHLLLTGPIQVKADNNWQITVPEGYQFAVGMPEDAKLLIPAKEWHESSLAVNENALLYPQYYQGSFQKTADLQQSMNVILSVSTKKQTAFPVVVSAAISHPNGHVVTEMKYLNGVYTSAEDPAWETAASFEDGRFLASENGTYTVLVKDHMGAAALGTVIITNINYEIMDAPVCNNFTNRQEHIIGTSMPFALVTARTSDGSVYKTNAELDGSFDILLPGQKAFDKVYVQTVFNAVASRQVELLVRRTGPDMPEIASDTSTATDVFSGFVDKDAAMVYFRYGKEIFVGKGKTALYKECDYYSTDNKITETDIKVEVIGSTAYFTVKLPYEITDGKTVWAYTVDKNNLSSKGQKIVIGS